MDNFFSSFLDIPDAIDICNVISILRHGGFRLAKCMPNSRSVPTQPTFISLLLTLTIFHAFF